MNCLRYIFTLTTFVCFIYAKGQVDKKDTIHIQSKGELKLNEKAVNDILFNFSPHIKPKTKISIEKPWMEFITEHPKEFIRNELPEMKMRLEFDLETYHGISQPVATFDADKILYETFTKRGRAIKRNRKKANAWKIYNDYKPQKEDSLNVYENKKQIKIETLAINMDSINHFMKTK